MEASADIRPASAQMHGRPDAGRGRFQALDMTKGVLVILMIIYHAFNYSTDFSLGFRYLPFLPVSFIVITGFLITKVYSERRKGNRKEAYFRLVTRGFRLLLLFTVLNMLVQIAGRHKANVPTQGISYFFQHWFDVYVSGEGGVSAFSILVPIAYLLLAAPVLIWLNELPALMLPLFATLLLLSCEAFTRAGLSIDVYLLCSAGVVGVLLGRIPVSALDSADRFWLPAAGLYLAFALTRSITAEDPLSQIIEGCLALSFIFALCDRWSGSDWAQQRLAQLGQYSLVGYIAQIAILQLWTRLFGRLQPFTFLFFFQVIFVLIALGLSTAILTSCRSRLPMFDRAYRLIF